VVEDRVPVLVDGPETAVIDLQRPVRANESDVVGVERREVPGKFQMLDEAFSANDLSPDGRYVVGFHSDGGGYLWTRENGYTLLGGEYAAAVSDDGTVVLGEVEDPVTGHSEAAIWNAVDGWQQLPAVGTGCPYFMSAYELSADGTAAVGLAWDNCSGTGFLWTEEGGTIAAAEISIDDDGLFRRIRLVEDSGQRRTLMLEIPARARGGRRDPGLREL